MILSIFYHSELKLQQESKHVFFSVNLHRSSLFSFSAEEILKEGKAHTLPQFKGSIFDYEKVNEEKPNLEGREDEDDELEALLEEQMHHGGEHDA
ncbi:hypothetical protein M5K25_016862 [Dendrobium thyrsiflorum]|uniref:Uncharacterized protein n=1 Tax=Dendrobium thyrsiflorum TaxID=117978 RepID=A0ABD0USQ3_DENTH